MYNYCSPTEQFKTRQSEKNILLESRVAKYYMHKDVLVYQGKVEFVLTL